MRGNGHVANHLIWVAALENLAYGDIDMHPHTLWLAQIFPDGVCNYGPGDVGRPTG